jgi:hypothetical protein
MLAGDVERFCGSGAAQRAAIRGTRCAQCRLSMLQRQEFQNFAQGMDVKAALIAGAAIL